MKNTIRASRNAGKKAQSSQAQKLVGRKAIKVSEFLKIALSPGEEYRGEEFQLSPKAVNAILRDAKEHGISLKQWVHGALQSQICTMVDKDFQLEEGTKETSCLASYSIVSHEVVSRMPLTDAEFGALWEHGLRGGKNYQGNPMDLIAHILRWWLANVGTIRHEFENAKAQSHALHAVFSDLLEKMDARYREEAGLGITLMVIDARKQMDAIYEAVEKLFAGAPQRLGA
jgi:predicted HicB family RNase H-like nuclease